MIKIDKGFVKYREILGNFHNLPMSVFGKEFCYFLDVVITIQTYFNFFKMVTNLSIYLVGIIYFF